MVITGLTRNQLALTRPRVRISPSPPRLPLLRYEAMAFLIILKKVCENGTNNQKLETFPI